MNLKPHAAIWAILLLFTGWITVTQRPGSGDDLTSSYVACRLLSTGQGSHIYSHHPYFFPWCQTLFGIKWAFKQALLL
jgi:hypothetical protein